MKRRALEMVRHTISVRADTWRRGVRCGADAKHDSPPGRFARGRVRSCFRFALRSGDRGKRALVVAAVARRRHQLSAHVWLDIDPAVRRSCRLWARARDGLAERHPSGDGHAAYRDDHSVPHRNSERPGRPASHRHRVARRSKTFLARGLEIRRIVPKLS